MLDDYRWQINGCWIPWRHPKYKVKMPDSILPSCLEGANKFCHSVGCADCIFQQTNPPLKHNSIELAQLLAEEYVDRLKQLGYNED